MGETHVFAKKQPLVKRWICLKLLHVLLFLTEKCSLLYFFDASQVFEEWRLPDRFSSTVPVNDIGVEMNRMM